MLWKHIWKHHPRPSNPNPNYNRNPNTDRNMKLILDYLKTAPYKTTQKIMCEYLDIGKQQLHYTIVLLKELDLINEMIIPDMTKKTIYYSLKEKTAPKPNVTTTI